MSFRASTGESGLRVLPDLFKNRVVQLAEETVDSLQTIWCEAGYEEVECHSLLGDLLHKLKMTCASELAAEQQILEHAKQQVAAKLFEYTDHCAQLGRPAPSSNVPSGVNYTDKLAELEKLISGIAGEVGQRQKLLNVEKDAIEELVQQLGESAPDSGTCARYNECSEATFCVICVHIYFCVVCITYLVIIFVPVLV